MDKSSIDDICPLSPMQEGFLFQALYDPDPEAYFVQINFRFRGKLSEDAFRQTWHLLSARHGVLRSAFVHEGLSRPAQVVLKQRVPEITFTPLEHLTPAEQAGHFEQFNRQDRQRGFDLARDVLVRIAVFPIGPDEHRVVWSFHHILLDGWCLSILQSEFVQTYTALIQGRTPSLPAVFPYGNYLRWLDRQDREGARRYWRDYLAGYLGPVGVPQLSSRDSSERYELRELMLELDADVTATLRAIAARSGVTFNTLVQCVWAITLARYNDVSDVVFGMIVSGRPPDLPGIEHMVGVCINAVPVRIRLDQAQPFTALLQETQRAALESQSRHLLPLAEIQAQTSLGSNLFNHLLTFENYPVETAPYAPGEPGGAAFAVEMLGTHDRTHYPLTFIATPRDKLHVRFSFNANVYPEDQVQRVREQFLTAARHVARSDGQLATAEVNILPEDERLQVLRDFNETGVDGMYEPGLVARLEAQVEQAPSRTAVVCEDRRLTYRELNERANEIAHYLRSEHRVQPDDRIGLWLDRSEHLVVAIWGILKAGAAYVPIDPAHPAERQSHMLSDSACRLVITEAKYAAQAARAAAPKPIADIMSFTSGNAQNPTPVTTSNNLAYILYTSGSTGIPKGCQIELGNLVNYLTWANGAYFNGSEGGCFGLHSPLSFDLTVTSLYLPLLRGKTLHVFPADAELLDIFEQTFREDSPIDSIKLTPSHVTLLSYLQPTRSNINLAIVGGEALKLDHVKALHAFNPRMAVYNEYGPTETTVGCAVMRVEDSDERILIGKPIANTSMYILRDKNPLPIGITGEVFIGGAGVGRGYINRDDLNHASFVDNPYIPGGRLYKSGDLGRWLPDGNLELLGRTDDQVKVRAYRVELGEIEQQLVRVAKVRDAAVTVRDQSELVAFLIPSDTGKIDPDHLRQQLAQTLPSYMIPAQFAELDEFPLTSNGKVNRQALSMLAVHGTDGNAISSPSTKAARDSSTSGALPRNATEKAIAEIWQAVLGRDNIGINENFFEIGGHSLKAIQALSRVYQKLGRKISLQTLFSNPTISAFAPLIDGQSLDTWKGIEPAPAQETYALSDAQKRLWIADRMGAGSSLNTAQTFAYCGHLNADALEHALNVLVQRHEILRTAFVLVEGQPRQKIWPAPKLNMRRIDLRHESDADARAKEIADSDMLAPFDLTQPTPLRAMLIELPEDRGVFLITTHHIVGDEWSNHVLYQEIAALYGAFTRGGSDPLPPLRIQYKDYAEWESRRDYEREGSYWLDRLRGVPEAIVLPMDFPLPKTRQFQGNSLTVEFTPELTAAARAFAQQQSTLVSYVMLAAFQLTLHHFSSQDDLCVGLSCANRSRPELERLIGFFVNIVPIRVQLRGDANFTDFLADVATRVTEAIEFQDYPFDRLIQKVNPPRRSNRPPLINVLFSYHDFEDLRLDLGVRPGSGDSADVVLTGSPWRSAHETSKFDLTLFVRDDSSHLSLMLEYDSSLFRWETASAFLSTLEALTRSLLQHPAQGTP
jgi:tyrocidine synthetase-3